MVIPTKPRSQGNDLLGSTSLAASATASTKLDQERNQPPADEALALPLLMKIGEVMRTLAIARRTVYELVKDGRFHLVRVGTRGSRIRTEEVLALAGAAYKPLRIPQLRNQSKDESAAQDAF